MISTPIKKKNIKNQLKKKKKNLHYMWTQIKVISFRSHKTEYKKASLVLASIAAALTPQLVKMPSN